MKTPFKIKISLKIFLGYFILVGLAALFVLTIFVDEVKPGVRQAMEDALVDTANVLAELAKEDVETGNIQAGQFARALHAYQNRANTANIWGIKKQSSDYRVYITNNKGIVIFDSTDSALGQDYSRWNDVYLTLQGKYGVRSSAEVAGDKNSDTVMYVAAPIKKNEMIIGSLTVAKPNRTLLPFIERAQQKIIRWGTLLFILSLVIGGLFTWRFTSKINKLREYALRVSNGEKATAPTSSNDELTELAMAMQTMRSELDGKQYIQDSVQHLTHELKSPITAIQGALELISPNMAAESQAKFMAQIKAQTNRVQTIIQNMLGLAELEHQEKLQHKTNINLKALIQTQLDLLRSKAEKNNIRYNFVKSSSVHIEGDAFLLGQAIYNLLENAIDFSPANSVIEIALINKPHHRKLMIKNAGEGIPDYALNKLFDKFYSLPRPGTKLKSTGLGLNFVQEITKLHGGSISIKNLKLNNSAITGVEAILTLPSA
jgi:two-component system, OmpR family, sensor histidine kinase CreC